jgi:hypothetical protein
MNSAGKFGINPKKYRIFPTNQKTDGMEHQPYSDRFPWHHIIFLYQLPYLPNNTKKTEKYKKQNQNSREFYRPFSPLFLTAPLFSVLCSRACTDPVLFILPKRVGRARKGPRAHPDDQSPSFLVVKRVFAGIPSFFGLISNVTQACASWILWVRLVRFQFHCESETFQFLSRESESLCGIVCPVC